MDAITQLFSYFNFRTDLFFIGNLCHLGRFEEPNRDKGYLHFIRQGRCRLLQNNKTAITITRPCIVFSPSHLLHHIEPIDREGLDIFCIKFDFGEDIRNPLTQHLEEITLIYLDNEPDLQAVANQIFKENEQREKGYQAAIQHLCVYFTIQVIRCCLKLKRINTGLLQGLTDKHLASLLQDIHQRPEHHWQLEEMANQTMMSRSKFIHHFKKIMGISAMDYVTQWRISVAQHLLQKGLPVGLVAEKVGYSHSAALSRVFVREIGITPTDWLANLKHD